MNVRAGCLRSVPYALRLRLDVPTPRGVGSVGKKNARVLTRAF